MNENRRLFAEQCRSVAESIEQGNRDEAIQKFTVLNKLAQRLAISKPVVGVESDEEAELVWVLNKNTGYRVPTFFVKFKSTDYSKGNVEVSESSQPSDLDSIEDEMLHIDVACDSLRDWAFKAEEGAGLNFPSPEEPYVTRTILMEWDDHASKTIKKIVDLFRSAGIDLLEDYPHDDPELESAFFETTLSPEAIAARVGYEGRGLNGILGAVEQWTAKLKHETNREEPQVSRDEDEFGSEYRLYGEKNCEILTAEVISDRFYLSKSMVSRRLKACPTKLVRKKVYRWVDVKALLDEREKKANAKLQAIKKKNNLTQ